MKSKIILISTLLAGLFIFSSCLTDTADYWKDDVAGKAYATFLSPGFHAKGIQPVATVVVDSFAINIASDALPTSPTTITFAFDNAAIAAYDSVLYRKAVLNVDTVKDVSPRQYKWNDYKPFPTATILTPTVTIPAGARTGWVKYSVEKADLLPLTGKFMMAISMTSVTPADVMLTKNMSTYLLALPIDNEWAGDYDCVGYRIRPGNPTEMVEEVETFSTVDGKTVSKEGFGSYFAYGVNIEITSEIMVVGGTDCFKVNCSLYDVATGGPVAGGMFTSWTGDEALKPDNTAINYYNPATKVFVLNMYYVSGAGNRIMYEVLTRK